MRHINKFTEATSVATAQINLVAKYAEVTRENVRHYLYKFELFSTNLVKKIFEYNILTMEFLCL